jgi:hypothetical protein
MSPLLISKVSQLAVTSGGLPHDEEPHHKAQGYHPANHFKLLKPWVKPWFSLKFDSPWAPARNARHQVGTEECGSSPPRPKQCPPRFSPEAPSIASNAGAEHPTMDQTVKAGRITWIRVSPSYPRVILESISSAKPLEHIQELGS